eukprot:CAMPEP_0119008908 /NCGR_PEP_ID=MMETSP1176-20130426/4017_1 /TAXON_ID=265551 /ORGANISM="Synedropsis recta cf, Strain CCMP1620" /LENGTH=477 /DNA_ID=CAMNT_0006961327 /DNA_START=79 /DNA_END=1512 /DNA_ORIENTATION=-
MTTNYKFKLFFACCALVGRASAMSLEEMIVDLEANLSQRDGVCNDGSIKALLEGSMGDCEAFTILTDAIAASEDEATEAAETLLLDNVVIRDQDSEYNPKDFVDEISSELKIVKINERDIFGCKIEGVNDAEDESLGTRSEPRCVENRVNEAMAIQMEFKLVGGATGVTDTDSSTENGVTAEATVSPTDEVTAEATDQDTTEETDPTADVDTSENTAPLTEEATTEETDATFNNKTDPLTDEGFPLGDPATNTTPDDTLEDEGIPLGEPTTNTNPDATLEDEGIPLGEPTTDKDPTDLDSEGIPFAGLDHITPDDPEFENLECVHQTFVLDKVPEIGTNASLVTNSRRIAEQVFLINQKLLDYEPVDKTEYFDSCTAGAGVPRVVNTTTLCRRRSIYDARIRQRVNYIGRNFPVCAGLQCESEPDDDFSIVFAESLLNGTEFWDQTAEGEYWTCSGAFTVSLRAVLGVLAAAALYLL